MTQQIVTMQLKQQQQQQFIRTSKYQPKIKTEEKQKTEKKKVINKKFEEYKTKMIKSFFFSKKFFLNNK